MSITLYHGSNTAVPSPRADAGRRNLDFGQGFYLTDIRQQAVEWAVRLGLRTRKAPVLNSYTFDRDAVYAQFRCKVFRHYDAEWLDFIVASRTGKQPWLQYDCIEGGVANDRVVDAINLYMADLLPREKVLERLSEHQPNNQICILNQTIIDQYLHYHDC